MKANRTHCLPIFRPICMTYLLLAFLLVFLLLAQSQIVTASEEALSAVAVPEFAKTETVAINIIQNGHQLSIARLQTESSIETVLEFYRNQWSEPLAKDAPGFIEDTAGDWFIISRPQAGWNQVVQVKPAQGEVEGRISVMELEPAANAVPDIAMPGNASLVSSTGADDIGHQSSTYVVFSESGINAVSRFYRKHFDNEGWSRVSDKNMNNAQVMLLQRTGERVELVVSQMPEGSGSLVVINKVLDDG